MKGRRTSRPASDDDKVEQVPSLLVRHGRLARELEALEDAGADLCRVAHVLEEVGVRADSRDAKRRRVAPVWRQRRQERGRTGIGLVSKQRVGIFRTIGRLAGLESAPNGNHELVVRQRERLVAGEARRRFQRLVRLVRRLRVQPLAQRRSRRRHRRNALVLEVDLVGPRLVVRHVGPVAPDRLDARVEIDRADRRARKERREGKVGIWRHCGGSGKGAMVSCGTSEHSLLRAQLEEQEGHSRTVTS